VTPGYAKPRSKLPWLPYESQDRVIINSHNFTPAGPIGMGGEIVWWCPSLDDSGNGTTTLNDLIGTVDGTLTNFALTGSTSNWVADTSNGGVTAIASDGTNDIITCGSIASLTGDCFWSAWMYPTALRADASILTTRNILTGGARNGISLYWRDNSTNNMTAQVTIAGTRYTASLATTLSLNTWYFVWGQRNGTTGVITVGVDGVGTATAAGSTATIPHEVGPTMCSWRDYSAGAFSGRIDDIRIFSRIPTAGEKTLLASKRGYQP